MRFEMSFGFRTRACRAIHMYAMHCGRFNISWRSSSWQVRIRGASSRPEHSINRRHGKVRSIQGAFRSVRRSHGVWILCIHHAQGWWQRMGRWTFAVPIEQVPHRVPHEEIRCGALEQSVLRTRTRLTFVNNPSLAYLNFSSHLCTINIQGHEILCNIHSAVQRSLRKSILFWTIEFRQEQSRMVFLWNSLQDRYRIVEGRSSWYEGWHCLGELVLNSQTMQEFCAAVLSSNWMATIELTSVNKQNLHSRKSRLIFVSWFQQSSPSSISPSWFATMRITKINNNATATLTEQQACQDKQVYRFQGRELRDSCVQGRTRQSYLSVCECRGCYIPMSYVLCAERCVHMASSEECVSMEIWTDQIGFVRGRHGAWYRANQSQVRPSSWFRRLLLPWIHK